MLALLSSPLHWQHSISALVQICIGAFDGAAVIFDGDCGIVGFDFDDGDVAVSVDVFVVAFAEVVDSVVFDVGFSVDEDDVAVGASDIFVRPGSIKVFGELWRISKV